MRNNSIGKAGEFFVAGELERRGFKVSLLLGNEEFYDLVAISRNGKIIAIQVKTTFSKRKMWTLDENKIKTDDNFYYVFVSINYLDPPTYHIVDGKTVFDYVSTHGKHWQTSTKRFTDRDNRFLNNWDSILN